MNFFYKKVMFQFDIIICQLKYFTMFKYLLFLKLLQFLINYFGVSDVIVILIQNCLCRDKQFFFYEFY